MIQRKGVMFHRNIVLFHCRFVLSQTKRFLLQSNAVLLQNKGVLFHRKSVLGVGTRKGVSPDCLPDSLPCGECAPEIRQRQLVHSRPLIQPSGLRPANAGQIPFVVSQTTQVRVSVVRVVRGSMPAMSATATTIKTAAVMASTVKSPAMMST
jgi:hypothetical protein